MSYRYKQSDAREKGLLDGEQVRQGLVEQLSSVQALDRDQLVHGHIGEGKIANGALHQMLTTGVNQENQPPFRFVDPALRPSAYSFLPSFVFPPGVQFSSYQGGAVELCHADLICKGGMIQAEFSCWTWRETFPDYANTNEIAHNYKLRLLINGLEVSSTGPVSQHWSSIHLVGISVAPEGSTRISVEYEFTGIDTAGLAGQVPLAQFCVGGTALLVQNRRR